MRYTPSGAGVLHFGVAVDEFWTDKATGEKKKYTSFFGVDLWGKGAEFHAKTLKKGAAVLVMGSLRFRSWEDKEGGKRSVVEIRGQRVSTLEWEEKDSGSGQPAGEPSRREPFDEIPQDNLDDIPT